MTNTQGEQVELLPCPFCGGTVLTEYHKATPWNHCVGCDDCDAVAHAKHWNTRAALQGSDNVGEAEELERRAREIEGDSDNPLRVAAANKLYDEAAALRSGNRVGGDDDAEWQEQHENLLAVRQQDITALTEARDKWVELCRRAMAYLPSTLGISKEIRAALPALGEAPEPVFPTANTGGLIGALEAIARETGKNADGLIDWQRCVDRIQEKARAALASSGVVR